MCVCVHVRLACCEVDVLFFVDLSMSEVDRNLIEILLLSDLLDYSIFNFN